jgi:hypothetical protein
VDRQVQQGDRPRLTWELEECQGGITKLTVLTVTHDVSGAPRLEAMVSGAMEDQGAGGGRAVVLSGRKTLLETGKPLQG